MVRFGARGLVLEEPAPPETRRLVTGAWHYARGLAYAAKGNKKGDKQARKELCKLRELRESLARDYPIGYSTAATLLTIAEQILASQLAAAKGDHLEALARLAGAIRPEDALLYNGPPDWYFPVRHDLGALLLDLGRAAEAEVVTRLGPRRPRARELALLRDGVRLAIPPPRSEGSRNDLLAAPCRRAPDARNRRARGSAPERRPPCLRPDGARYGRESRALTRAPRDLRQEAMPDQS